MVSRKRTQVLRDQSKAWADTEGGLSFLWKVPEEGAVSTALCSVMGAVTVIVNAEEGKHRFGLTQDPYGSLEHIHPITPPNIQSVHNPETMQLILNITGNQ